MASFNSSNICFLISSWDTINLEQLNSLSDRSVDRLILSAINGLSDAYIIFIKKQSNEIESQFNLENYLFGNIQLIYKITLNAINNIVMLVLKSKKPYINIWIAHYNLLEW